MMFQSVLAARDLKSYNISTAMKAHTTLRNVLVHPKDKCDDQSTTDAIEIKKRGHNTMNRDVGQHFLTHVFDELLDKSTGKKSTGPSEHYGNRPVKDTLAN